VHIVNLSGSCESDSRRDRFHTAMSSTIRLRPNGAYSGAPRVFQPEVVSITARIVLPFSRLTDQERGSIVAAPTFGLPEKIGGPRNWDYRYTWLRDSSFTLYAMMRLGFVEEATQFQKWISGRLNYECAQDPLQVFPFASQRIIVINPAQRIQHVFGESRTITLGGFEPSHSALPQIGMRNECNYRWADPS
jgi:Glycosyl hydrolases family 15